MFFWVEGPSDRIYINRWIQLLAPELHEGIDYSIMFYGGRLLSHLSVDRDPGDEVQELINLLRINQYSAIVIDSDQRKSADEINDTKKRIQSECAKLNLPCWITDGREIENSLPSEAIAAVYRAVTGLMLTEKFKLDQYGSVENALKKWIGKEWVEKWSYNAAKPKMARLIVQHITKENLGTRVQEECDKLVALAKHRSIDVSLLQPQ